MSTDRPTQSDKELWQSLATGREVASWVVKAPVSDLDFAAWLEGRMSEEAAARIEAAAMFTLVSKAGSLKAPAPRNYPCLPNTCDPSAESSGERRWPIALGDATQMAPRHPLGAIAPQDRSAARTLTRCALPPIRPLPLSMRVHRR